MGHKEQTRTLSTTDRLTFSLEATRGSFPMLFSGINGLLNEQPCSESNERTWGVSEVDDREMSPRKE